MDTLKMSIRPEWDEIEQMRNKCQDFVKSHKFPAEVVESITMVTSELIENAIKYGIFKRENDMVDVSLKIERNIIVIEVKNPIDDSAIPQLRHLDSTIQWIRGYQDPFETYIIKLRQVSTKPQYDTESGLGLVRISYEGKSILDFYVSEDNHINVSAVYKY